MHYRHISWQPAGRAETAVANLLEAHCTELMDSLNELRTICPNLDEPLTILDI